MYDSKKRRVNKLTDWAARRLSAPVELFSTFGALTIRRLKYEIDTSSCQDCCNYLTDVISITCFAVSDHKKL